MYLYVHGWKIDPKNNSIKCDTGIKDDNAIKYYDYQL